MSMARPAVAIAVFLLSSFSLTSCDDIEKLASGCSSTTVDSGSSHSILGIQTGMSRDEVEKRIECIEGAKVSYGTSGQFASDSNALLKELGEASYTNLIIATTGTERNCPAGGQPRNQTLDGNLTPDDVRFASNLIADGGFPCYSIVRQQIVVRFGGPPGGQRVTGVWRLFLPPQGERPQLSQLLGDLKRKYPALATEGVTDPTRGFIVTGFEDESGNVLKEEEIRAWHFAAAPTPPTPPATTESCGFLGLSTCPRAVSQAEQDSYQAASARYEADSRAYQNRKGTGDRYFPCVSAPPREPGAATMAEGEDTPCGTAYYAAAGPLTGGFAEAFFVGIYDSRLATQLKASFDDYLQNKRPALESTSNRSSTL